MSPTPGVGQQDLNDATSSFNVMQFITEQMLGRVYIAMPAQVMAVTTNSEVAPGGFVDVLPLVNQVDGAGQALPHGTVFSLPYIRVQGGTNAIICDPQVGDIGLVIVCDADISSVKANKGQANPGSFRRFSLADGIYVGGCLNGTPQQYVMFNSGGITIADKNGNTIVMSASGIALNSVGTITTNQDIVAGSISLENHIHGGVATGGGTTGPPT